jgi:hypothetical protein
MCEPLVFRATANAVGQPVRSHSGHSTGRVDAVDLFGAEQVARAWRYHRPLYAAAVAQLALGLLLNQLAAAGAGPRHSPPTPPQPD